MQRDLSSFCPWSEMILKCGAVPEIIHTAKEADCGFVSWTWDNASKIYEYPDWYIPWKLCWGCVLAHGDVPTGAEPGISQHRWLRWWLLYMGNPPFRTRVDFNITLWISRISKLSPYFPPFSVHFRYLSPKQLSTIFRFITALTVQSIIIISICFGPRFVMGNLMSLLDSNTLRTSPFWNILHILIIYIDMKENKGTSSYNLLWSHPSCFYFLVSQCTYLKHWTSVITHKVKDLKRRCDFFYCVLPYRLCIVHVGASGIVGSGYPVEWVVIIHDLIHPLTLPKKGTQQSYCSQKEWSPECASKHIVCSTEQSLWMYLTWRTFLKPLILARDDFCCHSPVYYSSC